MSGFVDADRVAKPDAVTQDRTIGVTHDDGVLEEHALIDVNRLRRGLIEFDEEIGARSVSLSVVEHDGHASLALVDPDHEGYQAIVVCGRVREEDLENGDQS